MKNHSTVYLITSLSLACVAAIFWAFLHQEHAWTPQQAPGVALGQNEIALQAYTTGYSFWDNTPPGTSEIAFPTSTGMVVRSIAGGTGTYEDPITLAVGHVIERGVDTPDYPPDTLFYIPTFRKYFIAEDTCGDGEKPQDKPCHKLNTEAVQGGATVWFDLWVGGEHTQQSLVLRCENAITGTHLVIQNPTRNHAVAVGPLLGQQCAHQYGDTLVNDGQVSTR